MTERKRTIQEMTHDELHAELKHMRKRYQDIVDELLRRKR